MSRFEFENVIIRCGRVIGKTLVRNVQSQRKTEQRNEVTSDVSFQVGELHPSCFLISARAAVVVVVVV